MKNYLLPILLFVSAARSFAQAYIPIPDTLAVWRQSYSVGINPDATFHYEQVFTAGKVTIDSFEYTELLKTGYGRSTIFDPVTGYTNASAGFFRNDIANKKVFFRTTPADTTDILLYDFNLQMGDTIHGYMAISNMMVYRIDTVLLFDMPHKRFFFADNTNNIPCACGEIIEGVGSTLGFDRGFTLFSDPSTSILECFSYKDSSYTFGNSPISHPVYSDSSCVRYTTITKLEESVPISVVQNKATGSLQLNIQDIQQSKDYRLSVFNVAGQNLLSQPVSAGTTTIYYPLLSAGMYVWQVTQKEATLKSGKFVVE